MRISDWSSDVSSSDLRAHKAYRDCTALSSLSNGAPTYAACKCLARTRVSLRRDLQSSGNRGLEQSSGNEGRHLGGSHPVADLLHRLIEKVYPYATFTFCRSEERLDGKECVRTCRLRW